MRTSLVWAGARHACARPLLLGYAVAVVAGATVTGCGGSKPRPVAPAPPPTYTPEEAALFNDLFRPELFGYPGVAPPEADTLLPDRVARASSVVPARVVTVSLEGGIGTGNYSVVVEAVERPLAGVPLSDSVTLEVAANSPIFGWMEGAARALVGTQLLLFVKFFDEGPHFHGSVDTPAVRGAIARARMSARRPR